MPLTTPRLCSQLSRHDMLPPLASSTTPNAFENFSRSCRSVSSRASMSECESSCCSSASDRGFFPPKVAFFAPMPPQRTNVIPLLTLSTDRNLTSSLLNSSISFSCARRVESREIPPLNSSTGASLSSSEVVLNEMQLSSRDCRCRAWHLMSAFLSTTSPIIPLKTPSKTKTLGNSPSCTEISRLSLRRTRQFLTVDRRVRRGKVTKFVSPACCRKIVHSSRIWSACCMGVKSTRREAGSRSGSRVEK
mmetsp:Transcript_563/g.1179  ORF Transcript_563/g.1179 Transcript_563/m.1179 type:complete len:248 (+) Transcript_563:1403-2146(+)